MQLPTVLIFASFLIALSLASVRFDYRRLTPNSNELDLFCRRNGQLIEDAKYYVNTTLVLGLELISLSPSYRSHSYRITRDREGNYSCGVHGSNSNEITLLGKAHIDTVQYL